MRLTEDEACQVASSVARSQDLKITDLKNTVNESLEGGLKIGGAAAVGGLVGGRVGMAVGAAVGTAVAVATAENFKPVHEVLAEMTPAERSLLRDRLVTVTAELVYGNARTLLKLIAGDDNIQAAVTKLIKDFVVKDLKKRLA